MKNPTDGPKVIASQIFNYSQSQDNICGSLCWIPTLDIGNPTQGRSDIGALGRGPAKSINLRGILGEGSLKFITLSN